MTQQEYENEIKELRERLEKLETTKVEESQPKRWKPKYNNDYCYIGSKGNILFNKWYDDVYDEWRYLNGNCFQTKKEAEEYKKQIEYTARYKDYIEEHSEPLDWNKEQAKEKYHAVFNFRYNEIVVEWAKNFKEQGAIYASSEQIIRDAIKEIGEDNFKKYVLGVK